MSIIDRTVSQNRPTTHRLVIHTISPIRRHPVKGSWPTGTTLVVTLPTTFLMFVPALGFIDDKETALVPAKQLGMITVLFESPEQLKIELQSLKVL